jgi:hypothetical protein
VLAPVCLAEIAPASRRGALVCLLPVNTLIDILLVYTGNFFLARFIAAAEV